MRPRSSWTDIRHSVPADLEEAGLELVFDLALAERYPGVDQYGLGTAFVPVGNELVEIVVAEPGTASIAAAARAGHHDA